LTDQVSGAISQPVLLTLSVAANITGPTAGIGLSALTPILGQRVTLTSTSGAPNNDRLNYAWTVLNAAAGSSCGGTSCLTVSATGSSVSFLGDVTGLYEF